MDGELSARVGGQLVPRRVPSLLIVTLACCLIAGATEAGTAASKTLRFTSTGAQQTFLVPPGVPMVHVTAIGGNGGESEMTFGTPGGDPAEATADLPVAAGHVLYVEVGGNGGSGGASSVDGVAGFNGGGTGGRFAGGGGGGSDVRTLSAGEPGSLATRLIVAGGGGGGVGGASGASAGAPGSPGTGGGPGTQLAGGEGGIPLEPSGGGGDGLSGGLGSGGNGGLTTAPLELNAGGGGGGGLYGGGGGGSSSCVGPVSVGALFCIDGFVSGGSGGGGSSGFVQNATDTSVADTSSQPSVTIEFASVPPAPRIKSSLAAQLVPPAGAARRATLLANDGLTRMVRALAAGTTTIMWYQVPSGAQTARATAKLVATGTHAFPAAGRSDLQLRLTRRGRALLTHGARIRLVAKGTFRLLGGAAISAMRNFTVRP